MKNLYALLLLTLLFSGIMGCTDDDVDQPLVECPAPSYLSGIITQVQAIQKEVAIMQAALPNTQGADRDALVNKINNAQAREKELTEELSNYRHCF